MCQWLPRGRTHRGRHLQFIEVAQIQSQNLDDANILAPIWVRQISNLVGKSLQQERIDNQGLPEDLHTNLLIR